MMYVSKSLSLSLSILTLSHRISILNVQFGHKFAERCGTFSLESDGEWSPVFHQFLDCVWQLTRQFPTAFEFNENLLIFLFDEV